MMPGEIKIGKFFWKWLYAGFVWRLVVPIVLVVVSIIFGALAAGTWTGLWNATGLLIGETSYYPFRDFKGDDAAASTPVAREVSTAPEATAPTTIKTTAPTTITITPTKESIRRPDGESTPVFLWLARISGILFVFNALFILLFNELREPIRRFRVLLWYFLQNDYVLVCGLGWRGYEIARQLAKKKGGRVVAIEKDSDNPFINELREAGVKVFVGDSTDRSMLERVFVSRAQEIYAVSGNDEINCRIVQQVENLLPNTDEHPCVHNDTFSIEKCNQCARRKSTRIYAGMDGLRSRIFLENKQRAAQIHVQGFSRGEVITREIFRKLVWPRLAVKQDPHMAFHIFGFSEMGKSIVLYILRICHLHEEQEREITIYCRRAKEEELSFFEEFPCLKPQSELTAAMQSVTGGLFPVLRFLELPNADSTFMARDFALYGRIKKGWQNHVFYCLDDGIESLALAEMIQPRLANFADEINENTVDKKDTMVYSYAYCNYPEYDYVEHEMCFDEHQSVSGPFIFGGYSQFYTPSFICMDYSEKQAKKIAAYYHAQYPKPPCRDKKAPAVKHTEEDLKKEADKLWELLTTPADSKKENRIKCYMECVWEWSEEWERESNRQAADHIPVKLALSGCILDDENRILRIVKSENSDTYVRDVFRPDPGKDDGDSVTLFPIHKMAEMEHRRWCAERLLGGWLPLESEEDKTLWEKNKTLMKRKLKHHGDLIPYESLQPSEKEKDYDIIKAIPLLCEDVVAIMRKAMHHSKDFNQ